MACALAFMIFNWPPARIFMGDSGSIFLGYIIGTLFLLTIKRGDITVWTWLVIFGYFFADTTQIRLFWQMYDKYTILYFFKSMLLYRLII